MKTIATTLMAIIGALIAALPASAQQPCPGDRASEILRYTTTEVNLRSCASQYCPVLVTLPRGEAVYAYRIEGDWAYGNVASLNVTGAVATAYLTPQCVAGQRLTRDDLPDAAVTRILMAESRARYSGSCPCPENADRAGRRCGARSAYSRPGGASPLCYPGDVSPAMIAAFRQAR